MNNIVEINNFDVAVKEYNSQRVVTFKDIDTVHERPDGTAKRNFRENRQHFIEGEDFFLLKKSEFQKDESRTFEVPNRGLTVLTESGYLMLVKSFTDDLAWKVQRELVNTYFRAKQKSQEYPLSIEDAFRLAELINSTPSDKLPIIRAVFFQVGIHIPEANTHMDNSIQKDLDDERSIFNTGWHDIGKNPSYNSTDNHVNDFLQGTQVINRLTDEVYQEYVEYCSKCAIDPISKIAFSKIVNKILGTRVIVKKLSGLCKRVFVC